MVDRCQTTQTVEPYPPSTNTQTDTDRQTDRDTNRQTEGDREKDDDSCCQRWPVSAGDAMNALAVLRDWLECNTAGVESLLVII